MKRLRGGKMIGNNYVDKKKAKRVVEKHSEEVKTEEEQRNINGGGSVVKEMELMGDQCDNNWINKWICSWNMVDEQMSWGTCWSPIWDIEFMGEAYVNNLYNDVLWDDDVWDLKAIKEVPSSYRNMETG
ncbi:hypothetical protein K7X08_006728 [Anisodus acutangulus]|uniref:Uncharacterized protein n=1 Tax=Anisodus acutangulus TaxID=402998 RepID=A0A9Q1N1Y6_9SOLA|nr:hypothetical protein K7X08_006728 [Anisodus acutangulus]